MDQFISIIVFSIPGLLVYFWILALGMNPPVKHSTAELAAIAALFWIPVVLLTIFTFNYGSEHLNWNWLGFDQPTIKTIRDLNDRALTVGFITYFALASIVFSLIVAASWVFIFDLIVLRLINCLRISRRLSKLSNVPTVWDDFFLKFKKRKEEPLVVEVYKLDKKEGKIIGSVIKMSRPFEAERSLVLEFVEAWTDEDGKMPFQRLRTYVDTKSGIVVTEINQDPNKRKPKTISLDQVNPEPSEALQQGE